MGSYRISEKFKSPLLLHTLGHNALLEIKAAAFCTRKLKDFLLHDVALYLIAEQKVVCNKRRMSTAVPLSSKLEKDASTATETNRRTHLVLVRECCGEEEHIAQKRHLNPDSPNRRLQEKTTKVFQAFLWKTGRRKGRDYNSWWTRPHTLHQQFTFKLWIITFFKIFSSRTVD